MTDSRQKYQTHTYIERLLQNIQGAATKSLLQNLQFLHKQKHKFQGDIFRIC